MNLAIEKTNKKSNTMIFQINFWVMIFMFTLYQLLPAFRGWGDLFSLHFGIIPLVAGIIINLIYLRKIHLRFTFNKLQIILIGVIALLWAIAYIREILFLDVVESIFIFCSLIDFIIILTFCFLSIQVNRIIYPKYDLRKALIYSLGLFVNVNMLLLVFGVTPKNEIYLISYPSQMLSIFGLERNRVLFPMSIGINSYGTLVGATLVGSFLLFKFVKTKFEKIYLTFVVLICLCSILFTDSRGALVFSIFSIFSMLLPKNIFKFVLWVPFLLSVFIVLIFVIKPDFLTEPLSVFNREPPDQIASQTNLKNTCSSFSQKPNGVLSNRPIIWGTGISELKSIRFIHLIGFGARGQVISGVSEKYSCLFVNFSKSNIAGLHNIWLQSIFEIGYLGLAITVIVLFHSLKLLSEETFVNKNAVTYPFLGILFYIVLDGTFESTITPDQNLMFFTFFMLVILGASPFIKKNNEYHEE
jgi:hypothetical protein